MSRLILHVGPPKCGSTSIQQFFSSHLKTCIQNISFVMLSPSDILELNDDIPNPSTLSSYRNLLSNHFSNHDVVILSHEFLFLNPYAIKNICVLANNLSAKVDIIGYARKQSDFLVSSYCQWAFRDTLRISEARDTLLHLNIDTSLFSGLEQRLITSIANDFMTISFSDYVLCNWHESYGIIANLVAKLDANLVCGLLDTKKLNLISDFCGISHLTLRTDLDSDKLGAVKNERYNFDLVEAINNSLSLGTVIIGPHDDNDVLDFLSSQMQDKYIYRHEFLQNIKSYIDSFFYEANSTFCSQYNLDLSYFSPGKHISKKDILGTIKNEEHFRQINKDQIINRYRALSAELVGLCIKLAKLQIR